MSGIKHWICLNVLSIQNKKKQCNMQAFNLSSKKIVTLICVHNFKMALIESSLIVLTNISGIIWLQNIIAMGTNLHNNHNYLTYKSVVKFFNTKFPFEILALNIVIYCR